MAAELPRGAVKAAAGALRDLGVHPGDNGEIARAAIRAALPLIARQVRRQVAREILDLDAADRKFPPYTEFNHGPYGDADTSLRRLARGEPLPEVKDLRGGRKPASGDGTTPWGRGPR